MFIRKENRIAVYSYLFNVEILEGVIVVKKDNYKKSHDDIEVPNLEVMNLMKSLKSRELVHETFNWQYSYYTLSDEGIAFLREYLNLPEEIVPATLKRPAARPSRPGPPGERGREFDRNKRMGPSDFNPEFRREGGFGRGGQDGYREGPRGGRGGFGRGSNF